jgi:polyisoprenoid-binding protein YceI
MSPARLPAVGLMLVLCGWTCPTVARAQSRAMDTGHSTLKVRVFKSGMFSAFAHDHEIEAPITQGSVSLSTKPSVELHVEARKLRVLDPKLSPKNRSDVQKTMEGPQVLDSNRFTEISFHSTAVESKGKEHWTVHGNLTLHGQSSPVAVDLNLRNGHYLGSARLKQRAFGITPVSIAGGTVKVKDEVEVEFDIVLMP